MSEKASLGKPSSWVPQLFFDLIGRVIPGSVLITLTLFVFLPQEIQTLIFNPPIENNFAASFLSLSIVMVTGTFSSYVLAISIWGVWYSVVYVIAMLRGFRFEPETLVPLTPDEFAQRYEAIKASDPAAGGRITKLKAESHMSSTLIVGVTLLLGMSACFNGATASLLPLVIFILGPIAKLLHSRNRIYDVLSFHPRTFKSHSVNYNEPFKIDSWYRITNVGWSPASANNEDSIENSMSEDKWHVNVSYKLTSGPAVEGMDKG